MGCPKCVRCVMGCDAKSVFVCVRILYLCLFGMLSWDRAVLGASGWVCVCVAGVC